jgi:hypothetical protein
MGAGGPIRMLLYPLAELAVFQRWPPDWGVLEATLLMNNSFACTQKYNPSHQLLRLSVTRIHPTPHFVRATRA